jgi:hypothetical protein
MKPKTPTNILFGSVYANAQAIGLDPFQALKLLKFTSAAELQTHWNYRAHGFKIEEARYALAIASSRKSRHKRYVTPLQPYQFCPRVLKYRAMLAKRDAMLAKRDADRHANLTELSQYREASSIEQITTLTAGYGYGYGCRLSLGDCQLLIKRIEDVTWSDRKSHHWPVSTGTSYQTTLMSATGDTLASSSFSARRGDWLAEAGKCLGLPIGLKNPVSQTASMIPVSSETYRGIKITRLRLFGTGFEMCCAESFGINYHAATRLEAIRGLVGKARAHRRNLVGDDKVITMAQAKKLGFCPTGIAAFLCEIDLDGRKSLKAGEIRSAMRGVDVSPWASELKMIGLIE